jgi:hypothetical protein
MALGEGERYWKGHFIPTHPGWLRAMVSKLRTDGLVEARGFRLFLDGEGNVLWTKPGMVKEQSPEDFERDLRDVTRMVEESGMIIFVQEFEADAGARPHP